MSGQPEVEILLVEDNANDVELTLRALKARNLANQVFVARDSDGRILGSYYRRANQPGGGAHVANAGYATAEAVRGRGVARAMALHSFDVARAAGFRAMQFNFVIVSNTVAVGLWQSLGFAIVGRLPAAFDHPRLGMVDALVMHRPLD